MNKPSTLRIITIVAPLLCLILAVVLTASQVRRLQAQETQRTLLTQQITSLDQLARAIQAQPPLSKMAAAPPSPDEQPVFLELIRGFAFASRVQLIKYENKTVPPPAQGSAEAKTNALPANVVALTSNVEVAGSYNQVRQFMNLLWTSPRLFNTTELKWIATDKWPVTRMSFVLTRYVHIVDTSAPKPNAPPHS